MEKLTGDIDVSKLTPAMKRYIEIKNQHKEYLLFYRMGDFYELFFDDALVASKVLDIALTHRSKNNDQIIPMCGVPFHAYESYMAKLIKNGYKVAICEQMETPEQAKQRGTSAVIKREVVRLVTSGTVTEENILNSRQNNYLLCCTVQKDNFGFAWIDLSTGEFVTQHVESSENFMAANLLSVLNRVMPTEIIVSDKTLQTPQLFQVLNQYRDKLTSIPQARFNSVNAQKLLEDTYKVSSLDAFGSFTKPEIAAAGIILDYIQTTQISHMPRLKNPIKFNDMRCMEIDGSTRHSLELCESANDVAKSSLLDTIDRTVTPLGARMLKNRLVNPSTDISEINRRLDMLQFFLEIPEIRRELRTYLKDCNDIERNISRLSLGRGGPRDMYQVAQTLSNIPKIRNLIFTYGRYKKLINGLPDGLEKKLVAFGEFSALITHIKEALKDYFDLPAFNREGGFIRDGYSKVLDNLREPKANGAQITGDMEAKYIKETGVPGLKIKYNSVIGYYIEVPTKFSKDFFQNPKFIHRQSVLTAARFTTAELSEFDQKASSSTEKAIALEIELYNDLSDQIIANASEILNAAEIFAELDIAAALAELSEEEKYTRPIIDTSTVFDIRGGRHPVVENALKKSHEGDFICNNCSLDTEKNRLWLLTGPNMAGKSTFLRQNALIGIMAQMGSYVPAQYAHIGVIDKIFSRVGASDDLARGRSTFMVEMVETAAILNQATDRSFVILDEIGRGTATYDGLSIAWSVVEHLHEINRCRALFATHYHELTVLSSKLKALSLHCMKVKEFKENIVFMHEVIDGTIDRSYGIHVAKLAGLPDLVLKRAEQILHSLEQNPNNRCITSIEDDLPLFSAFKAKHEQESKPSPLQEALKQLNPDDFSPREALEKLYELKKLSQN